MIRFFDPGKGYLKIKDEIDAEMQRVLEAGDLILRADVDKFEKTLAKYIGVKYAVALNSGTDALYLSLRALGIGRGDEVLVPSRTFVATAQVIVQVGAKPVFYDLDGEFVVNQRTKAIIPVHIEGFLAGNMKRLREICNRFGIAIIEDSAQALGSKQCNKMAGSFGDIGCFSFYPAKILGAYGDAGALVTNNKKVYEWVRDARNHFKEDARDWGVNSRMDNLQAAILNVKFKYLPEVLERRRVIATMYTLGLNYLVEKEVLVLPIHVEGRVWQDYIIRTDMRDKLFNFLKKEGIETMKNNYPFPVPKLPLAQAYEDETLRLPINENITDEEVNIVIDKVKQFFERR